MIEAYIQKNKAEASDEDFSLRQETLNNDEISDSGIRFP